jgi:hypothetical protein
MLRLHADKRAKASEMIHHTWLEGITVHGETLAIRAAEEAEKSSRAPQPASSTTTSAKAISPSAAEGGKSGARDPSADAGPSNSTNKRTMEEGDPDEEGGTRRAPKRASVGGLIPTASDEADALKPVYSSDIISLPAPRDHSRHVAQQHSPPPPQTTLPIITPRSRDPSHPTSRNQYEASSSMANSKSLSKSKSSSKPRS